MKRTRSNEHQAMMSNLAANRESMNYYRDLYNRYRVILADANRQKNTWLKRVAMSNMNYTRNKLKIYMGAVEIQLGII